MSAPVRVMFQGKPYVFLKEDDGTGALAYPEHCDAAGKVRTIAESFAHVVPGGRIMRHRRQIGVVADLTEVRAQ